MQLKTALAITLTLASTAMALGARAAAPPAWADPMFARRAPAEGAAPATHLLQGRAGAALTEAEPGIAEDIARRFVTKTLAPAGEMAVMSTVTAGGGVRFVTLEQRFAGVPVFLGRVTVAVAPDGSILAARVGELAPAAPPIAASAGLATPEQALNAAKALLGRAKNAPAGPRPSATPTIVATAQGAVRAWRVDLLDGGQADRRVQIVLDARNGAPLRLDPLVFPGVASARVAQRDPTQGFALAPCADPAYGPTVDSPAGWSFGLETSGNNTHVQLDREGDFWPPFGAVATASGDPPVMDFPWSGDPRADVDAALTNVNWIVNDAHDRFRKLGFDEASGACQADNFGRGGSPGDDRIWALVQYQSYDGSTPYEGIGLGINQDGGFTYLAVGVFEDAAGQLRDGAFEADLLYHELAHALSVRMVGDEAACMNGVQPQALSEGWSDFLAASITNDPVIGAWTSGLPGGVRTGAIGATGVSLVNLCESGCERFRDGEIWAGLLWDVRQRFIQLFGRARGVEMTERLVVEALRYTPCRPSFADARDAILLADGAISGGAHRCELWQLFVNRGLGASATMTGPDDQRPLAAYDLPPECSGASSVSLVQDEYAPDDEGSVEIVDTTPAPGATVRLTASGGDSLTLSLAAVAGGPLLRAGFVLVPGPANPADAVLQAAAGEILTATYEGRTDDAAISDGISAGIIEHYVYGNWCQRDGSGNPLNADDDALGDWYLLPRFLDPGEEATIAVTMGNALTDELEDLEATVTSLSPFVRVLPSTPFPIGTVGPRQGTGPRRFQVEFKATAALSTPPGTLADIRIDLRSRGRQGSATLRLELAMDYVLERGITPFAGGTETFDARTSTTLNGWSTTTPRGGTTEWIREGCSGNLTPGGWHVGATGCADYSDGQIASTLVSPPIFPVPADAVAYRLQDFSFSVDSNLYTDPANPFCEADFVGLFLTSDPAGFDYGNPEIIYYGGAQRWWRPIYEDTGGWATQGPFYYSTNPQALVPGADYSTLRMMWVFWGDVYDCGFELANQGRFAVDDVRFTFDIVRKVPETQSCAADCVVYARLVEDPPGPKCAGQPFTLRAEGWEQVDCPGTVSFSFGGPGVPGGGTTTPESPAIAADDGYYSLWTQCDALPDCGDYRALVNESPAPPALGTILPGSLRVVRDGADASFTWNGAAAPPSYGIWCANTRAQLTSPLTAWTLVGRQDGPEGARGENAWRQDVSSFPGALCFLRVAGRDRCSDAPNP